MSIIKTINKLNIDNFDSIINGNNKNYNENEKRQIGLKRNRQSEKESKMPCFKCKEKYTIKNRIKCNSIKEFIKSVKLCRNNNANNLYKGININENDVNEPLKRINEPLNENINNEIQISKIICNNCLIKILPNDNDNDNYQGNIFDFFFNNDEDIKNNNDSSNHLESSNVISSKEEKQNHGQEMKLNNINSDIFKDLNDVNFNEYEECLKDVVEYLNKALFEVSCFVKFYNIYSSIYFVNNRAVHQFYVNIFFQIYIQTKYRLNNLYQNGYKIIIKYQDITNKIITKLNKKNKSTFIENTNSILAKISNFLHCFDICLNFLRGSNNIRSIGQ